jgi:hypothetical protein
VLRGSTGDKVVLFVHGAGTPAEVSFDVPYQDYSWMALPGARRLRRVLDGHHRLRPIDAAGADERSVQPRAERQAGSSPRRVPQLSACVDDDRVRLARHRRRRRLRARAAPRRQGQRCSAGRSAAARGRVRGQHPEKVRRLVLLAPAYNRNAAANPPAAIPAAGVPMNTQSRQEFFANWDRQIGCADQYDPAVGRHRLVRDARVGSGRRDVGTGRSARAADDRLGLDHRVGREDRHPDAARRGRARQTGAARSSARAVRRPRRKEKVLVDLACSSHNAMWERNRLLLFHASEEWLTQGTVNGTRTASVKLGYAQSQ